jgi:hypothetical protein
MQRRDEIACEDGVAPPIDPGRNALHTQGLAALHG